MKSIICLLLSFLLLLSNSVTIFAQDGSHEDADVSIEVEKTTSQEETVSANDSDENVLIVSQDSVSKDLEIHTAIKSGMTLKYNSIVLHKEGDLDQYYFSPSGSSALGYYFSVSENDETYYSIPFESLKNMHL